MRVWLLALGGILLLTLLIYPPLHGRRPRWISAGLLALILVPNLGLEIVWQYTQATGSAIVRTVSGRSDGYLHCERVSETFFDASARSGEVRLDQPNRAFITWNTCNDFRAFLFSDKLNPTIQQITAVHVIVHEAIHVSGDYNEASTECKAMHHDADVLQRLGVPKRVATAATTRYRTEVYPNLPSQYQGTCLNLQ